MRLLKICPVCSIKNYNAEIFCKKCGTDLSSVHFVDESGTDNPVLPFEKTAQPPSQNKKKFKEYTVVKQFRSSGGEADIYELEKLDTPYILKLYRYGHDPNIEILDKIKNISTQFPTEVIKIYEFGFNEHLNRWYEIQEYAAFGTLQDLFQLNKNKEFIYALVAELLRSLKTIHDNNILHLDLKPSNILVRSKDPLNLVFTDFGISSLLDDNTSKKMTMLKGTPFYWAPETFRGIAGKYSDLWALGIMMLEFITHCNPFQNMDIKEIIYTLSTTGVHIPDTIDTDLSTLLKGLLTIDTKHRWDHKCVERWLNKEKNIPVAYTVQKEDHISQEPYIFEEKKCFTANELSLEFIACEKNWSIAADHLKRGYIEKWFEKNNDFDNSRTVSKIKEKTFRDIHWSLLKFIYTFSDIESFIFYGKLITLENIHCWLKKYLQKTADENESYIVDRIIDNTFMRYYRTYLEHTEQEEDHLFKLLEIAEHYERNASLIFKIIDFWVNTEKYYFVFQKITDNEKYEFIKNSYSFLVLKADLENIRSQYFLPMEIENDLNSKNTKKFYRSAKYFCDLQKENFFVTLHSEQYYKYKNLLDNTFTIAEYEKNLSFIKKNIDFDLLKKLSKIHDRICDVRLYRSETEKLSQYIEKLNSCEFQWTDADTFIISEIEKNVIKDHRVKDNYILFFSTVVSMLLFLFLGMFFLNITGIFYLIMIVAIIYAAVGSGYVEIKKKENPVFNIAVLWIFTLISLVFLKKAFAVIINNVGITGVTVTGGILGFICARLFFTDKGICYRKLYNDNSLRINDILKFKTYDEHELIKHYADHDQNIGSIYKNIDSVCTSINEIISEYEKDYFNADNIYINKTLIIKDTIEDIQKTSNNSYYIRFYRKKRIEMNPSPSPSEILGVFCYFSADPASLIQNMSINDHIEFCGKCRGVAQKIIIIRDCKILNAVKL